MQIQPTHKCLGRKALEPFFPVQEVDIDEKDTSSTPLQQVTPAAAHQDSAPPVSTACHSLLLGGPRQITSPGASAADPVLLSSPEPEGTFVKFVDLLEEDAGDEDVFPSSQLGILAQEFRATMTGPRENGEHPPIFTVIHPVWLACTPAL